MNAMDETLYYIFRLQKWGLLANDQHLIGVYFAYNVYSAVSGTSMIGPSNTAYWAHIGGAIFGFIMMWYWKKNSFNKNRWD